MCRYRLEIAFFREETTRKRMERIIVGYLNGNAHVDYDPAYVHILGPFVYTMRKEHEAYFCFQALMRKLGTLLCYYYYYKIYILVLLIEFLC